MDWSPEGVHYLHIAYTAIILGQVIYVAWLAARWARVSKNK